MKSTTRLSKSIVKKKKSRKMSGKPINVIVETNGNRKISSMSYNKKKTQINRNGMGSLIGFWVVGRKPHS